MTYHRSVEARLAKFFDEAEHRRELLVAPDNSTVSSLERRIERGEIIRPFRGFYARKSYWESLRPPLQAQHIIRTYSRIHPETIFSHSSAAVMHSLEVHWSILRPLHVLTKRNITMHKSVHITHHRTSEPAGLHKDGAYITSVEQTVADCAATLPLKYSLAIADSALHLGLSSKTRLNSYLDSALNRRGIRTAKRVIELADPRPDNGGESYVRAVMHECGLPKPELQVPIENPLQPGHYYYSDFMFTRSDGIKVALELDGREKYENPAMTGGLDISGVMRKERRREALITSRGLQVVRLSFSEASNPKILLKHLAMYDIVPCN